MFDAHAKESDPNSVLLVICHSHLLGICYSCQFWSRLWCTRFSLSPHLKTLETLSQLTHKEALTTKTSTAIKHLYLLACACPHKQNLDIQEPEEEAYLSKIIQKLKIIKIETYHLFHTIKMKRSNNHQGLQCNHTPLNPPPLSPWKKNPQQKEETDIIWFILVWWRKETYHFLKPSLQAFLNFGISRVRYILMHLKIFYTVTVTLNYFF